MNHIAKTLLNVMRIEVLLGIGLVAWVFSLEARAEYITGSFLAGLCASVSEDTADAGEAWESGGCVGYIVGVADALDHQHWEASGGLNGGEYCMPSEASRKEILEVVISSLHENPDNAESLAVALDCNALIDTFDCSVGLKYPLGVVTNSLFNCSQLISRSGTTHRNPIK
tara:strand:+ start:318 stop:827 length:510 start_codon:yes stop_codon:yes gene_type:complete